MIKLLPILKENITYTIYCDMDGVLVDFVGGYAQFMGNPPGPLYKTPEERKQFWDNFNEKLIEKGMPCIARPNFRL